MATQVVLSNGIYLPQLDLWLDARRRQSTAVVSHAHTDHWAKHRQLIGTPATLELIRLRWPSVAGQALPYGQPLEQPGYRLTFFPSGHCLGAAQVLIELEDTGERLVYTGDLKLRRNATAELAPIVPCDVLIVDATYGHPRYCFPADEETLERLYHLLDASLERGAVPVILAYAVGKAQEVVKLLLERGYRVVVDPIVYQGARVYETFGVDFGLAYECFSGTALKGAVLVFSSTAAFNGQSPLRQKRGMFRFIRMTGWALDGTGPGWPSDGFALPFSDHAGFDDLIAYVEQAGPRRVYTVGSFPHLAEELRRRGFDAWHLREGVLPLF